MKTYSEEDCIDAIENAWGEIESYGWYGNAEEACYRKVDVVLTDAAAKAAADRINSNRFHAMIKARDVSAEGVKRQEFSAEDIARLLGESVTGSAHVCAEYGVACFAEGGIVVFSDADEYKTWLNQR